MIRNPTRKKLGHYYMHKMTAPAVRAKVRIIFDPNGIVQKLIQKLQGTQKARTTRIINSIRNLTQTKGWEFDHTITHKVEVLVHNLWAILNKTRKKK